MVFRVIKCAGERKKKSDEVGRKVKRELALLIYRRLCGPSLFFLHDHEFYFFCERKS